ncbi:hypothetical protein J45TS6_36200 [Paenibacillus sp. J45TS6]|nr:hypothetical protein J45TS6_36200 [Paenibacillus sp. J45TS6]
MSFPSLSFSVTNTFNIGGMEYTKSSICRNVLAGLLVKDECFNSDGNRACKYTVSGDIVYSLDEIEKDIAD